MITLLTGTDDYRLTQRRRALVAAFRKGNPDGDVVAVDAEDESGEAGVAHLEGEASGGLFGSEKMFVVLHPADFLEAVRERFLAWLEGRREEGKAVVICAPGKFLKSDALNKKLLKLSDEHESFEPLAEPELRREISAMWSGKTTGVTLSPGAVEAVIRAVGSDLLKIDRELEKLSLLKTEGTISAEDVALFLAPETESVVFAIFDQLLIGRTNAAAALLEQEMRSIGKDGLFKLFGLFASQLRTLGRIHDCLARGIRSEAAVASALKIHPFVAKKGIQAAGRIPLSRVRRATQLLSDIDWEVKNGDTDIETVLTLFVWKF